MSVYILLVILILCTATSYYYMRPPVQNKPDIAAAARIVRKADQQVKDTKQRIKDRKVKIQNDRQRLFRIADRNSVARHERDVFRKSLPKWKLNNHDLKQFRYASDASVDNFTPLYTNPQERLLYFSNQSVGNELMRQDRLERERMEREYQKQIDWESGKRWGPFGDVNKIWWGLM